MLAKDFLQFTAQNRNIETKQYWIIRSNCILMHSQLFLNINLLSA